MGNYRSGDGLYVYGQWHGQYRPRNAITEEEIEKQRALEREKRQLRKEEEQERAARDRSIPSLQSMDSPERRYRRSINKLAYSVMGGRGEFEKCCKELLAEGVITQQDIDRVLKERGHFMPKNNVRKQVMLGTGELNSTATQI